MMPAQRTLSRSTSFASMLWRIILLSLLSLGGSNLSWAQDPLANNASNSDTNLLAPKDEFLPVGEAYQLDYHLENHHLLLHWKIAEGYYLYEERFKFRRTQDGSIVNAIYTQGKMKFDELFDRETMIHHDNVTATIDLTADTTPFALKVEYQGCAEAGLCYPPQNVKLWIDSQADSVRLATAEELMNTVQATPSISATTNPVINAPEPTDSHWLIRAILFAILGGTILNLMPCVFPVLSIKIMSLAAADRSRIVMHGWVYTLGIIACFVGFAIALLLARKGGEAIGWGFQLQSPGLIAGLSYLFFIMGLSMSGLIHFGTGLMGAGQNLTQKSGLSGSFFTGVLAAVVASPCTAPFMGAAVGFALTQPAIVCIAVFAALGFGMALPLLLLCYIPALADRLPKPGAWMDNLKHFLAYPLYLSAVWLLWVFGRQTSVNSMAALSAGAVAIAFGCWLLGREAHGITQLLRRLTIIASFVAAIFLPWQQLQQGANPLSHEHWLPYNPELLKSLRAEGRPVFVNLTADWCLTCLANERLTLGTSDIEQAFDDNNVATIKGDWTNTDPRITELLNEYGRSGVPLYLWFPAGRSGTADVLPQLLTKDAVLNAIKGEHTP